MRQVKQKEKEIKMEKKKVEMAFAKGNEQVARIHAENAIRKNNEISQIIKLASNIDSLASYVFTAMNTRKVIFLLTCHSARPSETFPQSLPVWTRQSKLWTQKR